MKKYINFSGCTLLTFLILSGYFISVLFVYLKQNKFLKEKEASKFMGIELIQVPSDISSFDSNIKIFFFYCLKHILILMKIFYLAIIYQINLQEYQNHYNRD